MPSTRESRPSGLHVAVIMDGNGRWAQHRGLPRVAGHRAGADAVRRCVEAARANGQVHTLTLYAFSSDNWGRPAAEVDTLMGLLEQYLVKEAKRCVAESIRLSVIGRRDRLQPSLLAAIATAESDTAAGCAMRLQLAVDYSSRDAILAAAGASPEGREQFASHLAAASSAPAPLPDVDLLIRTGGEQRLSDFLLWECAYAELYFIERMWPEFTEADLVEALDQFALRQRRFGRLPEVERRASGGVR